MATCVGNYCINQEPGLFIGTGQPIIWTAYESVLYGSSKFRYICDVYIDSGSGSVRVSRLKQLPNASNRAVFDISKIVNSFLYTTKVNQGVTVESIHTLPRLNAHAPFSQNDSTLESVICKFGYEKATSATTAPVVTADVVTETARYAFQGTVPYTAGVNYDFDEFIPDGTTKRFLTNMPDYTIDKEIIPTSNNEWRTFAFLNDSADCEIDRLYVQIYNSSDVLLNTSNYYFVNSNANGGSTPGSETNTDPERLLYIGIGVKNLNIQSLHTDMRLSEHPTAAYYNVLGADASNNPMTTIYRFAVDGNDCKFPMIELAWKNRLGQWDYFSFKKKSEKTMSIGRTSMDRPLGIYNGETYTVNSFDRGGETLTTEATMSGKANTDYISEKLAQWLQECFTSKEVYLIDTQRDIWATTSGTTISADDPNVIPVEIRSADYIEKTSVNNQCQIQYTISYKYAKRERVGV